MFKRTSALAAQQSSQASRFPFLAALAFLTIAILGFEAQAQGLQIAAISASEEQKDSASWEDYGQSNLSALNLDTSFLQNDAAAEDSNQVRVARIASCHEASLARYDSEGRSAPTPTVSKLNDFQSSTTSYFAKQNSEQQFAACAR